VLALAALVVRYRRGSEAIRRQLLWLVLAVIVVIAATLPWGLVAGTSTAVLFSIPLIPLAVTVAIVRYRLLDIRLVLSRALAWVLLSLGVVVGYATLVAVLDRLVSSSLGRSAFATVLLVLVAAPVLPRLQRLVDRAIYGDRANPARVVSQLGAQLARPPGGEGADSGLVGVVDTIRQALRLPYVALRRDDEVLAAVGSRPDRAASERMVTEPLTYGGRSSAPSRSACVTVNTGSPTRIARCSACWRPRWPRRCMPPSSRRSCRRRASSWSVRARKSADGSGANCTTDSVLR
jgi:two-component system NarL family sensor kinase